MSSDLTTNCFGKRKEEEEEEITDGGDRDKNLLISISILTVTILKLYPQWLIEIAVFDVTLRENRRATKRMDRRDKNNASISLPKHNPFYDDRKRRLKVTCSLILLSRGIHILKNGTIKYISEPAQISNKCISALSYDVYVNSQIFWPKFEEICLYEEKSKENLQREGREEEEEEDDEEDEEEKEEEEEEVKGANWWKTF
ncbi:hypothetical protein M0802_003268 [Mischocyttarus mexicanus]|nr:hypothetical protein M0802_003268 [Mischocyttarus mexicanus]